MKYGRPLKRRVVKSTPVSFKFSPKGGISVLMMWMNSELEYGTHGYDSVKLQLEYD